MGGPNKDVEDVVNLEPGPERDLPPAVAAASDDEEVDDDDDDAEHADVESAPAAAAPFPDAGAVSLA